MSVCVHVCKHFRARRASASLPFTPRAEAAASPPPAALEGLAGGGGGGGGGGCSLPRRWFPPPLTCWWGDWDAADAMMATLFLGLIPDVCECLLPISDPGWGTHVPHICVRAIVYRYVTLASTPWKVAATAPSSVDVQYEQTEGSCDVCLSCFLFGGTSSFAFGHAAGSRPRRSRLIGLGQ